MTEDKTKEDFGEYSQLAETLRGLDFSVESGICNPLKNRLLGKTAPETRRFVLPRWLLPAASAALAAAALTVVILHRRPEAPGAYLSYNPPFDSYSDCGRQGLQDYQSVPRF
ncbi:MAG: hypothetical protein WCK76_11475 [Elusimicrobiota bacterium]